MIKSQLYKFFLALLLISPLAKIDAAIAQEKSNFSEKNLPDTSLTQKLPDSTSLETEGSKSTLVTQPKDGLADLLLGNKVGSLMFDDDENSNIDRALDSYKNNQVYSPEENSEAKPVDDKAAIKEAPKVAEKKDDENEKSYIYLSSIIYFTPQDWVVWVNEQKITPKTNIKGKELYLKSVQKDRVEVIWMLSMSKWKILSGRKSESLAPKVNENNQVEVNFGLKPNQTFILNSNNVVEGRAVIALQKKKEEEKKVTPSAAASVPAK